MEESARDGKYSNTIPFMTEHKFVEVVAKLVNCTL